MADIQILIDSSDVLDASKNLSAMARDVNSSSKSAVQSAKVFKGAYAEIEASTRAAAKSQAVAQKAFNQILGVEKSFNKAAVSAKTFAAALNRADSMQKYYKDLLNIDEGFKSAEASASVFASSMQKQDKAVYALKSRLAKQRMVEVEKEEAALARATQSQATEIDRLAKKFNPLYAASKKYESALNELNRAQKLGAISAHQYGKALDLLNADFSDFNRGINRVGNQFGSFDKAAYKSAQSAKRFGSVGMQQVGYQVGDFAVQVQGGQNALVALGQQGTQLLGIFGPAGAIAGAFFAIGTAIGNVLWQTSKARAGIKTTEDAFKDLGTIMETIDGTTEALANSLGTKLTGSFDKASEDAYKFLGALKEIENRDLLKNFRSATDSITRDVKSFVDVYSNLTDELYLSTKDSLEFVLPTAPLGLATQEAFKLNEILGKISGGTADEMRGSIMRAVAALKEAGIYSDDLDKIIRDVADGAKLAAAAQSELEKATDKSTVSTTRLKDEIYESYQSAKLLLGAMREVGNSQMSASDSLRVVNAQIAAAKAGQSVAGAQAREQTLITQERAGIHSPKSAQVSYDLAARLEAAQKQLSALTKTDTPDRVSKTKAYNLEGEKPIPLPVRRPTDAAVDELKKLIAQRSELLTMTKEEIHYAEIYSDVEDALAAKKLTATEAQKSATTEAILSAERAIEQQQMLDNLAGTISQSFGDAFMSIVDGTKSASDAFKNMASIILKELFRILVVEQLVKSVGSVVSGGLSAGISGGATGSASGLGGATSGLRGDGLRAAGGSALPGQTLLVGERGPELINMGANRGTVINANQTASAMSGESITQVINFNMSANGDASVKQMIAQAAPQIAAMAKSSLMNDRQRGGATKRTFGG